MGSQNELVGGRRLIKYLSQNPQYITTWTEYGMQTRKTLNTDTFQIVIPRKMKSKFTLQGNKRLYPSESNACKLYAMQNYIIYPHLEQQIVFSIWVFFHQHSLSTGQQGKGEATSLTHLYHFRLLHRHLGISQQLLQRAHLYAQFAGRLEPGSIGFTNH